MQIEKVSYAGDPQRVTEEAFDCVWVRFSDRKKPSPLTSQVLQWVDWKLQGQLSRFILEAGNTKAQTTFVPTLKKLGSPMLAMETPGVLDWKTFSTNCAGLGLKSLLILSEEPGELSSLEKDLRRQSIEGLERVVLGSDAPVGRG